MIKLSEPMPHNEFVVKMVLAVLFVLGAGLSLMWLFDRLGGSFMSRGWQVFFIIVFAFLVAGLQIPGYIMDIRKIDMDNLSPAQPQTPKPCCRHPGTSPFIISGISTGQMSFS